MIITSYLTQRLNATYNGVDKHIENSEIEVSYYSTTNGITFVERFTLKNR